MVRATFRLSSNPQVTGYTTWGERRDLNPRHPGPQPGALPTELRPPSSPGRTAGPQQDARCPGGHRAAEDEYSRLRRPACDVLAAPAEPARSTAPRSPARWRSPGRAAVRTGPPGNTGAPA